MSPVAAVSVVDWRSVGYCYYLAVAAVGGRMTEKMGVSTLAGWESERTEGIKMVW